MVLSADLGSGMSSREPGPDTHFLHSTSHFPRHDIMATYPGNAGPLPPERSEAASKKMAAGICGILLGSLGVHKFILGYTTAGVIMLLISLLSCGFLAVVSHVIGIIEGIIYLTKPDDEFYETYMLGKKEWF